LNKVETTIVATGRNWVGNGARSFIKVVHELITESTKHLAMTIYLITSSDIVDDIESALGKGVNVDVFVCYSKIVDSQKEINELKRMREEYPNLNIFEVKDGVLHAKVLISDKRRALVGSANLTPNAMKNNYELGLLVEDGGMAHNIYKILKGLD